MAEVVLTVSSADEWNSVMEQAKQELQAGNAVTVKQTGAIAFGAGVVPMVELSVDPEHPAENFTYDGQGNSIWFRGANLLDTWLFGASSDWGRATVDEMPQGWSIAGLDQNYGLELRYSNVTDRKLVWKITKGQLVVFKPYAFKILYKSSQNGTGSFKLSILDSNDGIIKEVTKSVNYSTDYTMLEFDIGYLSNPGQNFKLVLEPVSITSELFFKQPWFGFSDVAPSEQSYGYGIQGLSIFGYLKNSTIKHVHIKWANFAYPYNMVNNNEVYGGILARGMERCTILNVHLENCQSPLTFYSGLVAGRAVDTSVKILKATNCVVWRPDLAIFMLPIGGNPSSGGLFGLALAPISIEDVELKAEFLSFARTNQDSYLGGLVGTLIRTGENVTIKRVATYPTFAETTSDSLTDALIGKLI